MTERFNRQRRLRGLAISTLSPCRCVGSPFGGAGERSETERAFLNLIDLLHELVEDIIAGQLLDGLAVDEEDSLALAACNADIGFAGLAGAIDHAARSRPP